MKKYLWCSVHQPTPEQMAELKSSGTVEFLKDLDSDLQTMITDCPADRKVLSGMARELLKLTETYTLVQVGGSPMFLYIVGSVIRAHLSTRTLLFAYTKRVSEDIPQPDGTIKKVAIFKHEGFY